MKKTIGIVGGTGKMGQFFADFFERNGHTVLVSGRCTAITNADLAKKCDAIIISVPIDATVAVIQEIGPLLNPSQCLADFTSLKKEPVEAMLQSTTASVLGMHPMFGPPLSGSIKGQHIVFCTGRGPEWENFFREIFEGDSASILVLNPAEHDEMMTVIQGLSHFLDISFAKTIEKMGVNVEKIFEASSPAYAIKMALMGRTLTQSAHLYGNIQISNPQNLNTLEAFFLVAEELKTIIAQKDLPAFEAFFEEGRDYFGDFADFSQSESDAVIDFLARRKSLPHHSEDSFLPNSLHGVGILGPENTFSHIAFEKFLRPLGKTPQFFSSIPAIFSALQKGKITEAFVPIENMLHGSIPEAIDGISLGNMPIAALFEMKISPSLFMAKGAKREEIDTIVSHSQPIAQCSQFLEREFPHTPVISVNSTTEAVQRAITEPHTAAIAAPEVVKVFAVEEIAKNIANAEHNATRFAFLSSQKEIPGKYYEGAIVFSFSKDSPGSLESVLHDFSSLCINLTKIESRPLGTGFGEYSFFVQFEGKLDEQTKSTLLQKISSKTALCNFLGNFPVVVVENRGSETRC
ncbi:MAG: prephenate dehydrogenase/arogenate dehydrogenase family protein [Candidatus Peregrinibacteria bacterium]